jgi:hypothetical protein
VDFKAAACMSNIALKEVTNKKNLRAFIDFPFKLYANNEYWVPPLIKDELDTFNPKKNPAFEYAEARLWLAYKNEKVVGRIAAIKHGPELEKEQKLRFGWIDFIDDIDVSKALLGIVEEWAAELGATLIHGPLGFNDMDFEGMLIDGFDEPTTIATIYNFPYYPKHVEELGYKKVVDWLEFRGKFVPDIPEKMIRTAQLVKDRFNFQNVELKSNKDIKRYGDKLFVTLNHSYADLYGFYRLTPTEARYVVEKYLGFLSPKYISLVADEEGEVVAFGVAMPSLSEAFRKANGRLLPFGFIHIIKAMLLNKDLDLYLIGINPKYHNTGVVSVIFLELWKSFINEGVESIHANPMLEKNNKLLNIWRSLGGKANVEEKEFFKRRRCYEKRL